ncbi:hypothetical protein BC628DRAFT_77893 [Trametes gibbosa]|nr:hypothetical protein BC628DRAFT_77893 [Trametes gibbosa]
MQNDPTARHIWCIPIIENNPAGDLLPREYQPAYNPNTGLRYARYHHEAGLTSRLDEDIFFDLRRILRQVAFWFPPAHAQVQPCAQFPRPANWVAVHSMPGSYSPNPPSRIRSNMLPDRCAIVNDSSTANQLSREEISTRCPGDIKPSYKFRASWVKHTNPQAVDLRPAPNPAVEDRSRSTEAGQVLAQVTYYMRKLGINPDAVQNRTSCTYGYVITDTEVVLLRRMPPNTVTDKWPLAVSQGFPLRPEVNNSMGISGMLALIYIHLLAGGPTAFTAVFDDA